MQMTARETLQALIEGKHDGRFDPGKHPRDDHGRWAHTPGGKRVKIPKGYHVGAQVEVHRPDFSREGRRQGMPMKWHRATVENVAAHESGRTLDVQMRMHDSGAPHVETIGIRGGNNRVRPVAAAAGADSTETHGLTLLPKEGRPEGKGTLDDPIAVGDDIERAAKLLAEGKHVRLDQPDQVVTLVDKLRAMVADAKSKGERAPTFDLGKVTVPGTNLFTQESKGIPRINMPQFRGVPVPGSPAEAFRGAGGDPGANIEQPFRDALAAMGIPTRRATVPASHLRASQVELDGAKTAGIASGMAAGKVKDVPIFVTRDNYIIDGHHRWAAKIVHGLSGGDASMPVEVVDLDIGAALDYANAFAKVMGIASQAIDDPGSGRAPVAAATKVVYVGTVFPADFRERMTKALAAPTDGPSPSIQMRGDTTIPIPAVGPASSRIGSHIDTVYGMTPVHHVRRGIEAAYIRRSGGRKHPRAANLRP